MGRDYKKILLIIEDIVYYVAIAAFIIIVLLLTAQKFVYPTKIPNIFGYKTFIVLNANMTEEVKYGDLAITKNIKTSKLKKDDIIAFRHENDIVGITKIVNIDSDRIEVLGLDKVNTLTIKNDNVEGLLVKQIPNVGLIFFYMQKPSILILSIIMVLLLGSIFYYIAQELDKLDEAEQE